MTSNITDSDIMGFLKDTSTFLKEIQVDNMSTSLLAAHNAGSLTNDVEFWKWIGKNYHCLDDPQQIQEIANRSPEWFSIIMQGKGYEWDFMTQQRASLRNLFSRFDAGFSPTQKGIDITKTNLLTGEVQELYQNKAYTSVQKPHLDTTPKDVTVVTNAENVEAVEEMGYSVEPFQDNETIKSQVDKRVQQAKDGKAISTYTVGSVAKTMAKAGLGAAVIGVTIETIASYNRFKNKEITKEQYLSEILKSGAISGIDGAVTAGIMIPISATVTAAGIAQPWLFSISFVISSGVNKIIAPAFGRGNYALQLKDAKYYQSLSDMQMSIVAELEESAKCYNDFIKKINQQKLAFCNGVLVNSNMNEKQKQNNYALQDMSQFDELNKFVKSI